MSTDTEDVYIPAASDSTTSSEDRKSCSTCSQMADSDPVFLYSIGRIQPRFPNMGIEKEFAQSVGRRNMEALSDGQVMHEILSDPKNRYLARKLRWVFSVKELDIYLLQPMNPLDLDMLIETLRPVPRLTDVNVVIGVLGPVAPSNYCNGLRLPLVVFDQLYSFDVDSLIKAIPKPDKTSAKNFEPIAEELFMKVIQMTDNRGATDEHRVLNYLAVRYPAIYSISADCHSRNSSLVRVDIKTSALTLGGGRKIMDAIFSFANRMTDFTEKYYCRVDVSEEFPFLFSKMQPFLDR